MEMSKEKELTGYPSIDKPWLKYYSEEAINAPIPECTIFEYIWNKNKDNLDDISLIFYDKKITYRDLFKNIDRVAESLKRIGVKAGDLVTLMMLNQPETVYFLYAINKIGAIASFINVLSSSEEIKNYLNKEKSSYFVVLDLFYKKAEPIISDTDVKKVVWISLFESLNVIKKGLYRLKVEKPSASSPDLLSYDSFLKYEGVFDNEGNRAEYAVIGHTGGTTGFPKGVMLTDVAINIIASQYDQIFKPHYRQEIFLNEIVPFAVYGIVINIHMPLSLVKITVLIPKVDPKNAHLLIKKYKPNYISSVPMYWTSIIGAENIKDLSFLKIAAAGGAGLSIDQINKINDILSKCNANTKLIIGYGMSEVGSTACAQMISNYKVGSVGLPLPSNIISAFDTETEIEKQYNELGEICICSPSLMNGYINDKEETDKVIRTHSDGRRWIHTGDLGYIDETGNVFIEGRIKRIYLTENKGALAKIFPDRIEKTILSNSKISDCSVVCTSRVSDKYIPYAFIVVNNPQENPDSVINEITALCKSDLPEYSQPVKFTVLEKLPLTPIGKVDYKALEKMAEGMENGNE